MTADGVKIAWAIVRLTNATSRNGTAGSYAPNNSIALPSPPGGATVAVVVTTVDVSGPCSEPFEPTTSSTVVSLLLVSSVVMVQQACRR